MFHPVQELITETDRTNALQDQYTNREREYREREDELPAENAKLRQEINRIKDSQHNTDDCEKMKKRLQREIETLTSINAQQQEFCPSLFSRSWKSGILYKNLEFLCKVGKIVALAPPKIF